MTAFWLSAALMTIVTIAAVAVPLLRPASRRYAERADYDITVYKDQLTEIDRDFERGLLAEAEADAAKIEIQRRMLKAADAAKTSGEAAAKPSRSPAVAGVLALFIAAGAFGLYAYKGSPDNPNRPYAKRNISAEIAQREGRLQRNEVKQLVSKLLATLEKRPGDLRGWLLLGRTYMTMDDFRGAMEAFRRATILSGRRTDVASDYAEAMVLAQNGNIIAPAKKLFSDILAADPFDPKARYYLGLEKAQGGDLRGAVQAWVDLAALSDSDAPWMAVIRREVAGLAKELGVTPESFKPTGKALALSMTKGLGKAGDAPVLPPSAIPDVPGMRAPATSSPSAPRGPSTDDVKAAEQMSSADRQQMIRTMVQRLADRLKENPDDLAGWQRLAKAYAVLGETEKAKEARARAEALAKKNP
ncbi:MAG: c-type cytochrome biogenesis protein CcmI [Rhodospirillales bacterium]|nr:c-type cytochrome biogenesis protein CcmI [Alphaproteobacteria bacterium]MBL6947121.1 c-type cytochrome biogenesis protein CcmI [Rhodospirillales bacterium]